LVVKQKRPRRVREHPRRPDTKARFVPMITLPYALRVIHADGSPEPVSEYATFAAGWSAGQRAVHEDRENAWALYRGDRRLARFGSGRLTQGAGIGHLPALLGTGS
jgi:hypothetical protein